MCPSPSTNECHRYYIRKNLPWSHRYFALCSHGLTHWSIVYYYNYLLKYLFFCLICELLKSNDNVLSHLLSSVQFSRSVVSDSLWPHEPQHARPPCPSPTPGVYPNSCPSSQWCHPTISSVVPFSSCPQFCSWGSQGKNTEVVCHSLLQWTTFGQTSPPWPVCLGWPHTAWLSFIELDKVMVDVIRLASFLWLWFQCVCPLTPSRNTYHLTWVSLALDKGYLFMAAPPDLKLGVAPLGPSAPVQLLLLGRGVASLGCPSQSLLQWSMQRNWGKQQNGKD